jgi:hypothetical protein
MRSKELVAPRAKVFQGGLALQAVEIADATAPVDEIEE